MFCRTELGEALDKLRWSRHRGSVGRIRQDAHESILGKRTRGPAISMMIFEPVVREIVVDVIGIEEGDQQVDVQ
jgi:hypothetical protein